MFTVRAPRHVAVRLMAYSVSRFSGPLAVVRRIAVTVFDDPFSALCDGCARPPSKCFSPRKEEVLPILKPQKPRGMMWLPISNPTLGCCPALAPYGTRKGGLQYAYS